MMLNLQTMTQDRELQMENLWKEFQSVLNEYLQRTEEFHNEYVDLRQKDDEDTKIIRFHYVEVVRATDLIADLKFGLTAYRDENRIHVVELKRYKKLLLAKQISQKLNMEQGMRKDKDNMRLMVVGSHAANTQLKGLMKKGEAILQIGSICRKLETEREKIMPFGGTAKNGKLFEHLESDLRKPPDDLKEVRYNFIIILLRNHMPYIFLPTELFGYPFRLGQFLDSVQ